MKGAGAPSPDPLLDGWPDLNAGWTNINTTRLRSLSVYEAGRVFVVAVGRRMLTTSNAWQKMPKAAEGVSAWSDFVHVYKPDLSGVLYSSIVSGAWDLKTGEGGGGVVLRGAAPIAGGVALVGTHEAFRQQDVDDSIKDVERKKRKLKPGDPVPVPISPDVIGQVKGNAFSATDAPIWGGATPQSEVVALLRF